MHKNLKALVERAGLYGMLAEFYKYTQPELHVHYYHLYLHQVQAVAEIVRVDGDPYGQEARTQNAAHEQRAWQPNNGEGQSNIGPWSQPNAYPAYDGEPGPYLNYEHELSSRIRILHASPDAPAVDVYANGDKIASGIKYKQVTPYLEVPAGAYQVEIKAAGTDDVLLAAELDVEASKSYTVAAAGMLEELQVVVMEDGTAVEEGKGYVRVAHLSPGTPAIDVVEVRGAAIFTNLMFTDVSPYVALKPDVYDLEIKPAGVSKDKLDNKNKLDKLDKLKMKPKKLSPIELRDVKITEGGVITLVAVGIGNETSPLEIILLADM